MRCTAFSRLLTLHVKSILHFIRVDCHKVSFFLHAELYFMVLYFTCKSGESKTVHLNVKSMRKPYFDQVRNLNCFNEVS